MLADGLDSSGDEDMHLPERILEVDQENSIARVDPQHDSQNEQLIMENNQQDGVYDRRLISVESSIDEERVAKNLAEGQKTRNMAPMLTEENKVTV